jgi:hypothetical protein
MKKNIYRILLHLVVFSFTITLSAQDDLPTDYLSKEFHAGRRDALRKLMPIIRVCCNGIPYPYFQ